MMNPINKVLLGLEKNGFDYMTVSVDDLVFSPFTRFKCMQCANYYSTYGCPPFTPTWKAAKSILSRYDKHLLVWKYTDMKKYVDNLVLNHKMEYSPKVILLAQTVCDRLAKSYDRHVQKCVDVLVKTGYDVLVLKSGGGCRRCKVSGCNLWNGKSIKIENGRYKAEVRPLRCRHGRAESALEAWGVDVYSTLTKLGVSFEPVPRTKAICVMLIAWRKNNNNNQGIERWLHV